MKRLIKRLFCIKTKKNEVYIATISHYRIETALKHLTYDKNIKITGITSFCTKDHNECTIIVTYEHYTY